MKLSLIDKIKNYIKSKYTIILFIIVFIFYILLTFKMALMSGRIPNEDEAHAWCIAGHLDIIQLIKLMKHEGHFLLWYLLLKPFAMHHLWYPEIMQFINWIFMMGAVLLLWLKSPFSVPLKTAITFSVPFTQVYPLYARCYTIGFFFLFLSMSFYKERLNHPYLYLLALVLCANTNLFMCVISSIMGILFLYDLIKNKSSKKTIIIVIVTALLNIILWCFQFVSFEVPVYATWFVPKYMSTLLGINPKASLFTKVCIGILQLFILGYFLLISKSQKSFIVTEILLVFYIIFFTKIYMCMHMIHLCLLYVIFIFSYWLFKVEGYSKKSLEYLLTVVFVFFIFFPTYWEWDGISYKLITDKKNITIFSNLNYNVSSITSVVPYLEKNNVTIRNMSGEYIYSLEHLSKIYIKNDEKGIPDFDKIAKLAKPGDLFFLQSNFDKLEGNNYIIYLKSDDSSKKIIGYLLEIVKIEKK